MLFNPLIVFYFTGRLFHCYMFDESIYHLRGIGNIFLPLYSNLVENSVSKQCRP